MDLRVVQVRRGLLSYGCRIQDADPVCAFSGGQVRSSVLGVRSSALIRYRVPGPRCQIAGTWNPVSGACLRKTRTPGMQDKKGSDSAYLVPDTIPPFQFVCRPHVRVFGWPGSVFGARCSTLGVGLAPVPGTRSQVPDSRYPIPGTRRNARLMLRKTRIRGMHPVSRIYLNRAVGTGRPFGRRCRWRPGPR